MAAQGRFATSWLQGKFGLGGPPAIQREDGSRTATIGEGFAELVSFWSRIWHREAGSEELDRLRAGTLTRGPPVRAHEWRLTAQDLQAAAASKRHGAAGPDGWTGEEVYAWPAYAWELFLDVWHRWAERDSWPRPMRCYRQIFMAKEKGEGAENFRPISIQSVFNRVVASAMARHPQVRHWIQSLITDDVHGAVAGRGVHTAVARLLQAWDGPTPVLVSMDLQKGFDMAAPSLMTGLLQHHGWPTLWARHLANAWHHQLRWLQHGNYLREHPIEVSTSTPQGDPMAPVAFVVLLAEAGRRLHDEVPQVAQALYVDDRNVIAADAPAAARVWAFWRGWTRRLGLAENSAKLRVVPKRSEEAAAAVRAGFAADRVTTQARVLGVDFIQTGSEEQPQTAANRWAAGSRIVARLASAGLAPGLKAGLARTRVTPLVTWGRWLSSPEDSQAFRLGTAVKFAVRGHRTASRDLVQLFHGHWMDLKFAGVHASFAALARALQFWTAQGLNYSGGQWFRQLCHDMQDLGWRRTLGGFQHSDLGHVEWPGPQLSAAFNRWIGRALHALRESWRRLRLSSFLGRPRIDSRLLGPAWPYSETVVRKARSQFAQAGQEQRGCLVGAVHSVARYRRIREEGLGMCPFCEAIVIPDWEHLAWQCPHFAQDRPFVPLAEHATRRDGLAARAHHGCGRRGGSESLGQGSESCA